MHKPHLNSALIRVLTDNQSPRNPVGAGFLVSDRHILTCAHVVCEALHMDTDEIPDAPLFLDFPLIEKQPLVQAKVNQWHPVRKSAVIGEPEDMALLETAPDSLPRAAQPVHMLMTEPGALFDREVRMCGFPQGMDAGDWVAGRLQGMTANGWVQIDSELNQRSVAPGFSGTAVWDKRENAVCGMVVSIISREGKTSAYMIPAATLLRAFPDLDSISRAPNPYKGLEAFQEKDAPLFFGRERVIQELAETVETQPFVAVIGASGSGKSSVVLAGLIPHLKASGRWLIRDFRPKDDPFYNLSLSLIPLLYKDRLEQLEKIRELPGKLQQAKIGLTDIIRLIAQEHPQQKLLLFADQFEELFTANPDKALQHRFMDMLMEPLSHSSLPFAFLFTMRADFMSQAVGYSPFAHALDTYKPKILSSMNADELTAAMEKPAEKLGVNLQSGLTGRILQDLVNEPGNLPLLEFALTQLWEKQDFRILTHESYDEIGGVKQALAQHADAVFQGFNSEEQQMLRHIFIQLVRPGEGTQDTRQVAFRHQFSEEKWKFVKRLADERLVVTGRNEENGQESLEVVHEALIQNWKPLQEWMNQDRAFRVWQERLRTAIKQWNEKKQDEGALLRGAPLAEAEKNMKQYKENLSQAENIYIETSIALREKEKAEKERTRLEREKLRKRINWIFGISFVVALILSGEIALKYWESNRNLKQAQINEIKALTQSSHTLFLANDQLNGLVTGIKAGKLSKQADISKNLRYNVINNLQKIVYNIREKNRLEGQSGVIHSLDFSSDGKMIASGSEYNTIKLWNVENGIEIKKFSGDDSTYIKNENMKESIALPNNTMIEKYDRHAQPNLIVDNLKFSPNSKMLASINTNNDKITLWNVEDGKEIRILEIDNPYSINFSPDGKLLASISRCSDIHLWNTENGEIKIFKYIDKNIYDYSEIPDSIAFSPDGKVLASGGSDRTVRLLKVEGGKEIGILKGHFDDIASVVFSPDGRILASGSKDKTIRLWEVDSGKEIMILKGHTDEVSEVVFSPDGKVLASGSKDKTVKLWNADDGEEIMTLKGHTEPVLNVCFSSDGKMIASGSEDETVRLWNWMNAAEIRTFKVINSNSFEFVSSSTDIKKLSSESWVHFGWDWIENHEFENFKKRNNCIFSADRNNNGVPQIIAGIRLWNVAIAKFRAKTDKGYMSFPSNVFPVIFNHNGDIFSSGVGLFFIHDNNKNIILRVSDNEDNDFFSNDFSPDGRLLALAGWGGIKLFDIIKNTEIKSLKADKGEDILSIDFSPDGKILASGSWDGIIRLWNVHEFTEIRNFKSPVPVTTLVFSPDGKTLVSGSPDNIIRMWNPDTGQEIRILKGHTGAIASICFSPDGEILASGSNDKTIRLWNVTDGSELTTLQGHTDALLQISFSPDGKQLASAGQDEGFIRVWNLDLDDLLFRGCKWAYDYLKHNPNISKEDRYLCDDILNMPEQ